MMTIFWIAFSIFFIIASIIGVLTIISWIVKAIKVHNYSKIAKKQQERKNQIEQDTTPENVKKDL